MAAESAETLVVDASVAVKWHLADEEYEDEATLLIKRFAQGQVELVAPEQIRYEVPSAITVAARGRKPRITRRQGEEAIAEFLNLGITTAGDSELILSAYALVHQHGCALCDALYLALAERLATQFITADRKLYQMIRDLPYVLWIGDYPLRQSD